MRVSDARRIVTGRRPGRSTAVWRVVAAFALIAASVAVLPGTSDLPGALAQDLIIAPPSAPGLTAPENGATLGEAATGIEMQWQAVPGALEYQVIINDGQRTGPWVVGTSWSPGTLPEGAYQWTVRSRNEAGASAPGPAYTFTILPDGEITSDDSTAPGTLEFDPLPLPLQQQTQQGQQGQDGSETASSDPAMAGTDAGPVVVPDTALAATPAPAGTPVPADPVMTGATGSEVVNESAGVSDPGDGNEGDAGEESRKKDKAKSDEPSATTAVPEVVPATDSDSGNDGERDGGGKKRDRKRKDRNRDRSRTRSNGNGGVSEVIAAPPEYRSYAFQIPAELQPVAHQQDASDATSGAVGESGTVNGQPRETAGSAMPEVVGPGAPADVLLPPSVPGLPDAGQPAPGLDPATVPGVAGTTELTFDAVADATVFTSSPGSPQSPESINYLALGGPSGAVSLMSFKVEGVGNGTVLSALLTFTGAGGTGAPGGGVGVIYGYVVPDEATANGVPGSQTALNVHGAPSWFERVEPNGVTAVDVSGSVSGDGRITFVLPGQPEQTGSLFAMESGNPPQLVLTVALAE